MRKGVFPDCWGSWEQFVCSHCFMAHQRRTVSLSFACLENHAESQSMSGARRELQVQAQVGNMQGLGCIPYFWYLLPHHVQGSFLPRASAICVSSFGPPSLQVCTNFTISIHLLHLVFLLHQGAISIPMEATQPLNPNAPVQHLCSSLGRSSIPVPNSSTPTQPPISASVTVQQITFSLQRLNAP